MKRERNTFVRLERSKHYFSKTHRDKEFKKKETNHQRTIKEKKDLQTISI